MTTAIVVASVMQEGLDLRIFLSNFKAKDMAKIESIGKVERETTGSMVKEIELEGERSTAMEIFENYIHYSMD